MNEVVLSEPSRVSEALATWQRWPIPLHRAPRLIKAMSDGTTNKSYLIEAARDKYPSQRQAGMLMDKRRFFCLRVNAKQSQALGIDRQVEANILQQLRPLNIVPKLHFYDSELNISLFDYVEGRTWTQHDLTRLSQRERLFKLIDQYQRIKISTPRFDYYRHLSGYIDEIEKRNIVINNNMRIALDEFMLELKAFMQQRWQPVLCHHDLIPENILETDNGIMLLDWEYAGLGHPEFDRRYFKQCLSSRFEATLESLAKGDTLDKLIRWLAILWQKLN